VTDTFDLSLGGPAALVATLGTNKVTLAPGASQVVTITTQAVNFAVSGQLPLFATATSEGNPAVQAGATAALTIGTTTGLTASASPGVQVLPVPGTTSFLVLVNNTGNLEDAYTATITGTTGPVTANLMGLDGLPAQTIPLFRLPGLSTGALLLQTNLTATGPGKVNVQVQSLNDPTRTAAVTATVSAAQPTSQPPPPPPVLPPPVPPPVPPGQTPLPEPVITVVSPPGVAEGAAGSNPPLWLAGGDFTPASVVFMWAQVGKRLVVVALRTLFVNGVLVVWLPATLPGLRGKRWVLGEGDLLALSVFTPGPGLGLSPLLRVPVLEAVRPGQVGTAAERAEVNQLEERLGREVTLDDMPQRVL
jgi:hypothetical protein